MSSFPFFYSDMPVLCVRILAMNTAPHKTGKWTCHLSDFDFKNCLYCCSELKMSKLICNYLVYCTVSFVWLLKVYLLAAHWRKLCLFAFAWLTVPTLNYFYLPLFLFFNFCRTPITKLREVDSTLLMQMTREIFHGGWSYTLQPTVQGDLALIRSWLLQL